MSIFAGLRMECECITIPVRPELVEGSLSKDERRRKLVEGRTALRKNKKMAFWVYILRCADGSYYTGHTDDLEKRIAQHHSGEYACYTLTRRPLALVFSEEFPTREEALTSERQIKGWGRKKKEAMIRGDWAEVSRLAKSRPRK